MTAALRRAGRSLTNAQGVRFVLVGGFNTAFSYVVFSAALLVFGFTYLAALVVAHFVAVSLAFFLHRRFVFDAAGTLWIDFLRCHFVYLGQLATTAVLLVLLTEVAGLHPMVALPITVVVTPCQPDDSRRSSHIAWPS